MKVNRTDREGASQRRRGRAVAGFAVVVLGTLSAIGLGAAVVLATAVVESRPAVFLVGGLLTVIVVTFAAGWGGFRVLRIHRPCLAASGFVVAIGLIVVAVSGATILRPFPQQAATQARPTCGSGICPRAPGSRMCRLPQSIQQRNARRRWYSLHG